MSKWTPEQFRSAARNIRDLSKLSPSEIESAAQMLEYAAHFARQAEGPSDEDCRTLLAKLPLFAAHTPIEMVRAALTAVWHNRPAIVFTDTADEIESRMASDTENACPHCGGSGHKDDVQAQEKAEPVGVVSETLVSCDGTSSWEDVPNTQSPKHGDDAHSGLRYVMCQVGFGSHYTDWLLIPHADGQYVTAAKLTPFSMGILRSELAFRHAPTKD